MGKKAQTQSDIYYKIKAYFLKKKDIFIIPDMEIRLKKDQSWVGKKDSNLAERRHKSNPDHWTTSRIRQ